MGKLLGLCCGIKEEVLFGEALLEPLYLAVGEGETKGEMCGE